MLLWDRKVLKTWKNLVFLISRFSATTGGRLWTSFSRPTTFRSSPEEFARPRARARASSASTSRRSPSRTSSAPSSTRLSPWDGSSRSHQAKGQESASPLLDPVSHLCLLARSRLEVDRGKSLKVVRLQQGASAKWIFALFRGRN